MPLPAELLIIDAQNDFCDLPPSHRPLDPLTGQALEPALPVPGAHADLQRLAGFIRAAGAGLTGITATLDSHHRVDIAHPTFWVHGDGEAVAPFTEITAAQVRSGAYRPRDAQVLPRALAYLDELEARGRYKLMVWPVHCEIGTWGHNLHADVQAACAAWEERTLQAVRYAIKGTNPWTEHYSALQAEVPDPQDPETGLNEPLLRHLDRDGALLIAGQASSHCVRATTEHLVQHMSRRRPEDIVLLSDCMSPVNGFAAQQQAFFDAMRARGVQVARSTELL
ncbi:isochorismatase family protein [Azohydromonas australica]|uniref:isochorismatase family protein n=1 Tax=Azohydromonas australica TaxID=364039 RepID=UPI00048B0673|nr:isochorismatase family protein [Azohydromonas australica]